jgi:hypothetical protein
LSEVAENVEAMRRARDSGEEPLPGGGPKPSADDVLPDGSTPLEPPDDVEAARPSQGPATNGQPPPPPAEVEPQGPPPPPPVSHRGPASWFS